MNSLKVIVKNELIRYFISPLAYVYLIAFLLLNGSFALYFGHFFERGQADLLSMFAFQPWLYLLFVPGRTQLQAAPDPTFTSYQL